MPSGFTINRTAVISTQKKLITKYQARLSHNFNSKQFFFFVNFKIKTTRRTNKILPNLIHVGKAKYLELYL